MAYPALAFEVLCLVFRFNKLRVGTRRISALRVVATAKNLFEQIFKAIHQGKLCRHNFSGQTMFRPYGRTPPPPALAFEVLCLVFRFNKLRVGTRRISALRVVATAKNLFEQIFKAIHQGKLCRHNFSGQTMFRPYGRTPPPPAQMLTHLGTVLQGMVKARPACFLRS